MKLSVIITAYDQHELTVAHVKGCMNSIRVPDEIIVINDCGDPSLLEMLRGIDKKTCPIIYARINTDIEWNQNGARNLGLYLSKGDYIALEDNDHIPFPDFYRQAEELLKQGNNRVMVRKRYVISRDDIGRDMREWKILNTRGTARIISVNEREVLTDVKGFDEQFCGRYGWDVPDFVGRTALRGIKEVAVGSYYVVGDWLSNEKSRKYWSNGTTTKMDEVNYHHLVRNRRNKSTQSPIGILNFNYEVHRF